MKPVKGSQVFLDTNIFLRYSVIETPEHAAIRTAVGQLLDDQCGLWISRQVIREFSAVMTRPQTFVTPLTASQVASALRRLLPFFRIADETALVTDNLLGLMEQYMIGGKQVHDANIVATLQAYHIAHLFTLNEADFARFSGLITIVRLEEILKDDTE